MVNKFFADYTKEKWLRLLTIMIIVLFIVEKSVETYGAFAKNGVGVDFLAFWSAGKIADEQGYAKSYDLILLQEGQLEERIATGHNDPDNPFDDQAVPVPFFPIFIAPFQLISRLNSRLAFELWSILNLILFMGYLSWFFLDLKKNFGQNRQGWMIIFLFLFSVSTIDNFTVGQVEILLLVFMGEFLRSSIKKKQIRAGVWLGLMLLKPQILFLVIPALILMKNWKILLGFCVTAAAVLSSSLVLAGWDGLMAMFHLWFANSEAINNGFTPAAMMNWRAVALLVNDAFVTRVGWILAALGTAFSLYLFFKIIRLKIKTDDPRWAMVMLGIFLASCITTWHAHEHMIIAVMPLLLFGFVTRLLPKGRVIGWIVVPQAVWLVSLVLVAFEMAGVLPDLVIHARLRGLSVLAVNLGMLVYLSKRLNDTHYGQEVTIDSALSK